MISNTLSAFFALMLVQVITGQYINNCWGQPAFEQPGAWGQPLLGSQWGLEGYNPAMLAASNAGGLAVSSSSPIAPVGVTMTSENAIEGPLAVAGRIPFLGAVEVDGMLPTAGAGAISYGSGNGQVAMLNEDLGGYGYGVAAPGLAGPYNRAGYAAYY